MYNIPYRTKALGMSLSHKESADTWQPYLLFMRLLCFVDLFFLLSACARNPNQNLPGKTSPFLITILNVNAINRPETFCYCFLFKF
jgi:hypothetical protein